MIRHCHITHDIVDRCHAYVDICWCHYLMIFRFLPLFHFFFDAMARYVMLRFYFCRYAITSCDVICRSLYFAIMLSALMMLLLWPILLVYTTPWLLDYAVMLILMPYFSIAAAATPPLFRHFFIFLMSLLPLFFSLRFIFFFFFFATVIHYMLLLLLMPFREHWRRHGITPLIISPCCPPPLWCFAAADTIFALRHAYFADAMIFFFAWCRCCHNEYYCRAMRLRERDMIRRAVVDIRR